MRRIFFLVIDLSFGCADIEKSVNTGRACRIRTGERTCAIQTQVSQVVVVSVKMLVVRAGLWIESAAAPRRVLRSSWNNTEARGSERSIPLCGSWNGTNAFRANLHTNSPSPLIFGAAQVSLPERPLLILQHATIYYGTRFLILGKNL